MSAAAIILAAGEGARARGIVPKQIAPLAGRRVLDWSKRLFCEDSRFDQVIVVTTKEIVAILANDTQFATVTLAEGGASRTASVKKGLDAITRPEPAYVFIHDAARPGVDAECLDALFEALENHAAAAPALPVSDALKRQSEGALANVDRTDLYRVQTPQAFHLSTIREALNNTGNDLVDDLAAVEMQGAGVALTKGSARYNKITYPEDFEIMDALFAATPNIRIGKGFDVHAFEPGDHVTLCGIQIEHTARLKGHSDADVAWHALTDAILGALALGDIGDHFPPSDEKWRGADSGVFLKAAVDMATDRGFSISNCDLTLICEEPKVKPHRKAMRLRTADVTDLPIDAISVKATTTEGLGFTGRREGIAAEAVVTLSSLRSRD